MNLKRLLSLIYLAVFCFSILSAKEYYLSTTGNDNSAGTFEAPFASLEKAVSVLNASDICYVRGGEYYPKNTITIKKMGSKDQRIRLFAYKNEKPVFNFEKLPKTKDMHGIYHKEGDYWHYKGLTFCNAGDNGMRMKGSYIVIENCTFRGNNGAGLQIGFGKGDNGENTGNLGFLNGRNIIILNCDAYDNYDIAGNGGNADGFAAKLFPGPGIEFHGCRSWNNSDDGWDFYYTYFPYLVNNCWSMKNGKDAGNGNGFKMGGGKQGGEMSNGSHIFTNCIAIDNKSKGFDQNNHDQGVFMINCVSARNNVNYGFNNAAPTYGKWYLRNNIGFAAVERNHQFNEESTVDVKNCSWITFDGCNKFRENKKIADYTPEFKSLAYEDAIGERQSDGSLPVLFGRLNEGSKFIDAGINVTSYKAVDVKYDEYSRFITIPHIGDATDMGAFQYGIDNNDYELVMPGGEGGSSIEDGYATAFDIYQAETAMIVYGEIASLRIFNIQGSMVSNSSDMQVVNTSHLSNGIYILNIEMKDGQKVSKKFIRN